MLLMTKKVGRILFIKAAYNVIRLREVFFLWIKNINKMKEKRMR